MHMAFGIDDALTTAASAVSITKTLVETVEAYRHEEEDFDLEQLLQEVRGTALERIDEADRALRNLERTLVDKEVDLDQPIQALIRETPWWKPFEQHRLKRINRGLRALSDATYDAIDDIAALLRCHDSAASMGKAVVESADQKHELHRQLLDATVREAIDLLRSELTRHKDALTS